MSTFYKPPCPICKRITVLARISYVRPTLHQEEAMTTLENTEAPCTELSDAELSEVSAGKSKGFVQFGDIKGESTDLEHRDP